MFIILALFCICSSIFWSVNPWNIEFRLVVVCIGGILTVNISLMLNIGLRLYYVITNKKSIYLQTIEQKLAIAIAEHANSRPRAGSQSTVSGNDNVDPNPPDIATNNIVNIPRVKTQDSTFLSYHVTATKEWSLWNPENKYIISNCLIAILGIGKYNGMHDLIGVSTDYKNLLYTFYQQMKYSACFMDNKNSFQYFNRSISKSKSKSKSKRKSSKDKSQLKPGDNNLKPIMSQAFKLEWSDDEIDDFIKNVKKTAVENKHDSLMVFISSHGDTDGVILDSSCGEVELTEIFSPFFGDECIYLLDKPKLFFVDSCRGGRKSRISIKKEKTINDKKVKTRGESLNKTKQKLTIITDNKENSENNKENDEKSIVSSIGSRLDNLYHNEANIRFLFANPDGYAAVDGGIKGGYLIQATTDVFGKQDEIYKQNLDSIVNQIRLKTRKLVGTATMQNVEDVNHFNFNVFFAKGKGT